MLVLPAKVGSASHITPQLQLLQLWNRNAQCISDASQACVAGSLSCAGYLFEEIASEWVELLPD
jgi:hypothetical protein